VNRSTRINVATVGAVFGLSGMSHGFFETLQGNLPTPGLFVSAIGEAQRMWPHGNEPAFTVIPNFLATGIAAMLVGLALIVWSLGFVHRRRGPAVFLGLFVLLLLVGGGVAQVLFFPFFWLASTRIRAPLGWWRGVLRAPLRARLARGWPWFLALSAALLVGALVIATTGFVPGVDDPEAVLGVMLACLLAVALLLPLAFVSGFARDLDARPVAAPRPV
jgi:hypothetical protein